MSVSAPVNEPITDEKNMKKPTRGWISWFQQTFATGDLFSTTSYANDAAAATGGVRVGQFYRNGSVIQVRVS